MTPPDPAWRIPVGGDETTAVFDRPAEGEDGRVFICAHGAGGRMNDRAVLALSHLLTARGLGVVRFNFLYRERGTARPDPMPRLVSCLEAVVDTVRRRLDPRVLVLGGRSMGGRAASVLVSNGGACDGLLLLAYPLHPPGQPEKLRADHLAAIRVPVLCLNGTRDSLCEPALMQKVLAGLGSNWRMHWLEGADHGSHVLKRSGRTDAEVLAEAADETMRWLAAIG